MLWYLRLVSSTLSSGDSIPIKTFPRLASVMRLIISRSCPRFTEAWVKKLKGSPRLLNQGVSSCRRARACCLFPMKLSSQKNTSPLAPSR